MKIASVLFVKHQTSGLLTSLFFMCCHTRKASINVWQPESLIQNMQQSDTQTLALVCRVTELQVGRLTH